MIYPTEMTVTTGTTVYAGDPDSDERIVSREVRVSVTFQIEDEDVDLVDLAFAKAAEVERARLAACDRIRRNSRDPGGSAFAPDGPSLELPDDEYGNRDEDENYGNVPEAIRVAHGCVQDGGHAGNGVSAVSPSAPPWVPPAGTERAPEAGTERAPEAGTERAPEAETDWATRPQVLAIGSHFKRLGVGPADQTALLRARFGKFRPERLTRDEAACFMRSLERGEVQIEPAGPAAENTDGRRFTATSA